MILSNVYFDNINIGDNIIKGLKESVDTNHVYVDIIKCLFWINIGDDIIKGLKESVDTNHLYVDIIKYLFW